MIKQFRKKVLKRNLYYLLKNIENGIVKSGTSLCYKCVKMYFMY